MAFRAPQDEVEPSSFRAPQDEVQSEGFRAPQSDLEPVGFRAPSEEVEQGADEEGNTAAEYVAAYASEIAISEGGRTAAMVGGTAVLPGVGTAIGYVLGGLGAGAAGSIARQRILDPDGELSYGDVVSSALINLIPGAKAGKSVYKAVGKQAAAGAAIATSSTAVEGIIDDGKLPTLGELGAAGLGGATLGLGLGMTGEVFTKAYSKFGGMPTRRLTEAFKIGDPDAKILVEGVERTGKEYAEMLPKNFKDIKMGISDAYSDEMIRARVLQDVVAGGQIKQKDAPLKVKSDESDFYMQRRLSSQHIAEKAEEAQKLIELDGDFLMAKAQQVGSQPEVLSRSVNEYLYAKHGISYNKANRTKFGGDGAAGRSTQEFNDIINRFESQGLHKQLGESIELRQDLSKRILNTLESGGLISNVDANKLRKKFPDYVPLNRIMETDELADVVSSVSGRAGRYETTSSGIRRAKGSELEVDDIYKNVFDNLINATQRAEVNKANQAFVRLIRDNPTTSGGIAKVAKPQIIGTKVVKDTSDEANALRALGKNVPSKKVPIYKDADKNTLTVFENGKPLHIEINDPKLAAALKGTNKQQVQGILKTAMSVNRFLGGLYTRFNPEFVVPNLVRDRSEAFVNSMANMQLGKAAKLLNPVTAFNDDIRTIRRNLLGNKAQKGTRQSELDDIYEEFVEAGGRTGGLGLSTIQDINDNLKKLSGKINQPTKSKAKDFNNWVNRVNEYFENATRFAVYRNGRAGGMTKDQAAFAARNSSFDPNLQGSQGDSLRALYLFSNPAIQGAKNFLRSMKKPVVATSVMATLASTSYTLDRWNSHIDEDWREKIPKFKINKHMTIVRGKNPDGSLDYFSIPIGYSMVPFKIAADYGQRIMFGDDENIDAKSVAGELSKSIIDSYNPMGGSPIPTVLRPLHDIARNKDGLGRDIRPHWLEQENISAVEKIYPWTARTQGGELAMNLAEQLEDMGQEVSPETLLYLYQNYTGGPGTSVKRLFNMTSKMWNGEKVNRSEVPILRRFYGATYAKAFEMRTGEQQILDNVEKQDNTTAAKASRIANVYKHKIKGAGSRPEIARILQDMSVDQEVNESVVRRVERFIKDDAAGITSADRRVKSLSKAARAQYFVKRIEGMEREQAARYIQEQVDRKVLTDGVQQLMLDMQSFKDAFSR